MAPHHPSNVRASQCSCAYTGDAYTHSSRRGSDRRVMPLTDQMIITGTGTGVIGVILASGLALAAVVVSWKK